MLRNLWLIALSFLFLQNNSYASDTLRIFSWNIFMVPPLVFKSDQVNRGKMIAEVLDKSGADVVILQEVFMEKVRKSIHTRLEKTYSYQSGKPQGGGFLKGSSGVWILSRYPIDDLRFVKYKDCKGTDCFSKKGAYLFSVTKNDNKLYMAATHVQSGSHKEARQKQFRQLAAESALLPDSIPLLIIGDLNTDLHAETEYREMLEILQASDGICEGEKYSYSADNDLAKRFFGESNQFLDYMLLRDKQAKISFMKRTVHKFTSVSFGTYKFNDLSDHHAITGEVVFK